MNEFSPVSCVASGWKTFKERPWFFAGTTLLFLVVIIVVSVVFQEIGKLGAALTIVAVVARIAFEMLAVMGLLAFALKANHNAEQASLVDFWHPQDFWKFLASIIVQTLLTVAGILLFVVPGIMVMVSTKFAPFFIIEKGEGPIESIFSCTRAVHGRRWAVLEFIVLLLILNMVGAFALLIGLLVTVPVTLFASAHAYKVLSRAA